MQAPEPQTLPRIQAVGSGASPILLPMSAIGPVPLNVTLASDSTSPNASSAFILIPAVMEAEKNGTPPDLKPIQPWDLAHPSPVYSETSSVVLLHKTPKVVLKKRHAVQVFGRLSSPFRYAETEILQQLGLPRSQSPLIANRTVLENPIHDSVTVLRNSGASSFFDYWESKSEIGYLHYTSYLRLSLEGCEGHKCDSLWHYKDVIPHGKLNIAKHKWKQHNILLKVHSYHFPTDTNTTDTLTFGPPIPIGRITVSPNVARALFTRCLQPKQKHFDNQGAYDVLSKCFHKPTLDSIPNPQSHIVANLLRDSLFVVVGNPRAVSLGAGPARELGRAFCI